MCALFDEVEFKMLGVEGKEFQKINRRKERFSQLGSKPFDAGSLGSETWLSFLVQLYRLTLLFVPGKIVHYSCK